MGEQNYSRWFVDWPSTHRLAGQTVEVTPVSSIWASLTKYEARIADLEAEVELYSGMLDATVRERDDQNRRALAAEAEVERLREALDDLTSYAENIPEINSELWHGWADFHANVRRARAALASLEDDDATHVCPECGCRYTGPGRCGTMTGCSQPERVPLASLEGEGQ